MEHLPDFLKVPFAVVGYRASISLKRPVLEPLFDRMLVARTNLEESRAVVGGWSDEQILDALESEDKQKILWETGAHQALYDDLGSVLVLLVVSTMERFFKESGISLYERGLSSYVDGVPFSKALSSLANQYRHLGAWRKSTSDGGQNREIVEKLVDNALRTDAASEFLRRSGFTQYESFEDAVLSCSDGIADPSIVVDGRDGLRRVVLHEAPSVE